MHKLEARETDKKSLNTTRSQRRLLVLGSSLIVLFFLIGGTILPLIGSTASHTFWFFGLIALISFICQSLLYKLNATRIASMSDKEIDERQKRVRDQAYRYAYRIMMWVATVVVVLIITLSILTLSRDAPNFPVIPAIGFLWLMMLLPTWIVAWTEQDI
jgi:hypothetical protein